MVIVELGPAVVHAVGRKLAALRGDVPALHLFAEVLVHLSTYGTAVVAYLLDSMVGLHLSKTATALTALVWLVVMLRLAYKVKRHLHDLEH
jgi:hypothetical protein